MKSVRLLAVALIATGLGVLLTYERVTEIVISKSARSLVAYAADGKVVMSVPIGLGRAPEGHKHREGDQRTPEGEYYVCFRNPQSRYRLSLGLSYPNPQDAARGRAEGAIDDAEYAAIVEAHRRREIPPWKTALGGEIFIHGRLEEHDVTAGCVAIRDRDIDALFPLVAIGTRVRIVP
jgi:murein L,D-transpeptidase YafK